MLLAGAAGCGDNSGAPPVDARQPAPVEGTWHLERTVTVQPSSPPGCDTMRDSSDTLIVDLDADPPIALPEDVGFDPGGRDYVVTPTSVRFVAEEFFLLEGHPTWPILIGHDLQLDQGQLVGTAESHGDDSNIGCTWLMAVVGTRVR